MMPGLTLLGVGQQRALLDRAKKEGVDVLIVFSVKITPPKKTNLTINEASIALLDVRTFKRLHATKTFRNTEVQRAREANKDDGLDKELEKLFAFVDSGLKLTALPSGLNSENVKNQVRRLLGEKYENPLPVLAEIKLYQSKGLYDKTVLHKAYNIVLKPTYGKMLASDNIEDRKRVLDKYLPES